jgi:putative transcriptional regulator
MASRNPNSLKNHFLIALPTLGDGFFTKSITYLCEHDEHGAMGLVINHPMDIKLSEILTEMKIEYNTGIQDGPVLAGGPVQTERGFIMHRRDEREWQNSLMLSSTIALTTSPDVLQAFGEGSMPKGSFVTLGYAGWDAGQLENEILQNCWLTLPATDTILFDTPYEKRVDAALNLLGIRMEQLTAFSGHA